MPLHDLIRAQCQLSERAKFLRSKAIWDLNNGPIENCEDCGVDSFRDCTCPSDKKWPGFSQACRELRNELENLPSRLYYDNDCDFLTENNPSLDGSYFDDNGNYVGPEFQTVNTFEIRRAIFGRSLAEYI